MNGKSSIRNPAINRQSKIPNQKSPIENPQSKMSALSSFPLHAIVDADVSARYGWDVRDVARAFLAGGARLLQLRAKNVASGLMLQWAESIVALARPCGAQVIVNDRADVARLAGADGVHIGQDDLSPAAARALVGPDAIVGVSTHDEGQIAAALREPVTYIAIGPIFGTATKDTGYAPVGLEMVQRASRAGTPVVAIGGITLERAPGVIAAGAASVAVIGDLLTTGNPEERVRAYLQRLRV
jgi:thiamine-phosphate pyrophosphorylase